MLFTAFYFAWLSIVPVPGVPLLSPVARPALACAERLHVESSAPLVVPAATWSLQRSWRGEALAERFGTAVASAGDVNADGTADWIVSAPSASSSWANAGRASVFSGADGAELLRFVGDSASDRLGSAVASAGDVDGDGHADVLIGAPRGTPPEGSAYLYSGKDGTLLRAWQGSAAGDEFGRALAGLGDVDGDGVPDVAVGAPLADFAGTNSGSVTIFSGATGLAIRSMHGAAFDQFGRAVCALGDVNGDGSGELLVGTPFADTSAFNGGSASVFNGADGVLLFATHGDNAGDQLGFALAAGRDVNLDGVGDWIVAAPGADAGGLDSGAARVCSGLDGTTLMTVPGSASAQYLSAVALLADANGDGRAELVVGAASALGVADESGEVRVLSGRDGQLLQRLSGAKSRDWFGAALAAGDTTNLVVGAPGHDDELDRPGYAQVFVLGAAAGNSGQ